MLEPHLYEYQDEEAVRHMFRVAASLDSMVVGEAQILGQVKQSWNVARELGAVKGPLDKLLQGAFSAAKRVRTETEIGSSSVSIASVAVDLARRIFGSLEGKKVLIVGAGKMSELAARHLMQHGAGLDDGGEPHLGARGAAGGAVSGRRRFRLRICMRGRTRRTSSSHRRARREQISAWSRRRRFCTGGRASRCSSSILRCRATWTRW